jgi:hypothetical protein
MDRELAGAVVRRWDSGLPVSETALYKAASELGIDPMAALVEARFYTYFDNYLLEKRAMSKAERIVFSAAAGISSNSIEKSASAYGLNTDELIIEALKERNFVPDIQKIANLQMLMDQTKGMGQGQGQQGGPPPGMPGMPPAQGDDSQNLMPGAAADSLEGQAGGAMMAPPSPDAALQQQPDAREQAFKPSPMAPEQVPPSDGGNLEQLLGQGQEAFGQQATDNGGVAPAGMPEPAPPPPSPEERIQQVGPNLDPETTQRYAEQLSRFEQGFGMQINDPKQMVKFVKELQKVDGKKVDQGIKAMGQQLEQEQAQELGVDNAPTIDGPGGMGGPGKNVMSPKPDDAQSAGGGATGGPPQGSAPPQQGDQKSSERPEFGQELASAEAPAQAGPPQQKPQQGKPSQKPSGNPNPAQSAVEKVANAARILARTTVR